MRTPSPARNRLISLCCATLVAFSAVAVTSAQNSAPAVSPAASAADSSLTAAYWAEADVILARIQAPAFPARDFVITAAEFGAVADGKTLATAAIRKAIEAAHAAGGGRVVIPAGVFATGAIHLKSNVNLHVSEGATLAFSTDPKDYLPAVFTRWEGMECMGYSPLIYAFEQENIAVTGKGILDGRATTQNWWPWKGNAEGGWKKGMPHQAEARKKLEEMCDAGVPVEKRLFAEGSYLRPMFIQPYRSKNVLIEGVTILNSPMWEIHPVLCTNVTVRGVKIKTHGPNNDGCNPESSKDVLIEDTIFDTGDDCIAIKSGRNTDGRRLNIPSENIIIRNCKMVEGHGGVVIGSEISGGARNVFVENCEMSSPELDRALRFKTNSHRGGTIENVYVRNVKVGQVKQAVILADFFYEEGDTGKFDPILRNVVVENLTAGKAPHALFLRGYARTPIGSIKLINCRFEGVTKPSVISHVASIEMINCFENTGAKTDEWGNPLK
ncbi:glycoside hydrolase [Nibricoccus aquaticus]|uniref:Glycoside hydrolase n=1 Tax=Nibricoccus aquaticus TaxID=2576891 RepID=A0A290QCY0_9BACT|nr:glycoside hydrolase family 28 protein [Nibricoccus aquaticus]ATC64106.1 glycoside hydrolase [Nibricoccus aquaticus]